jgi:hypothetical protein
VGIISTNAGIGIEDKAVDATAAGTSADVDFAGNVFSNRLIIPFGQLELSKLEEAARGRI